MGVSVMLPSAASAYGSHRPLLGRGVVGRGARLRSAGAGRRRRAAHTEKISLKVDLNKFVKGQKLAGITTINFQNNITDIGWMNEVVAYQLYRDAGGYAPRTTYAKVYL